MASSIFSNGGLMIYAKKKVSPPLLNLPSLGGGANSKLENTHSARVRILGSGASNGARCRDFMRCVNFPLNFCVCDDVSDVSLRHSHQLVTRGPGPHFPTLGITLIIRLPSLLKALGPGIMVTLELHLFMNCKVTT